MSKYITQETLAHAVNECLDLTPPRVCHHESPAYKIVKAIFKVMADALRDGKRITIADLGSFKTVTHKSKFVPYRPDLRPYVSVRVPPRKVIKFTPSRALLKQLNTPGKP